ncbi:hypothetical protein [Stakelama marina]|uniref:Uncharacterized protein n=1 Tax=Stakelama marina TaxID=2826939 RepID=A0A8T4IKH7_9SPHN|nr:hypothetical protein [Stakelama marina]MBR0552859.1 hypothetical protein [Stakelama marina]
MAKALAQFAITAIGDEYIIHIEDEDGDVIELMADDEQLEMINEAVAEQYERDEDTMDIDDEDELGLDDDD